MLSAARNFTPQNIPENLRKRVIHYALFSGILIFIFRGGNMDGGYIRINHAIFRGKIPKSNSFLCLRNKQANKWIHKYANSLTNSMSYFMCSAEQHKNEDILLLTARNIACYLTNAYPLEFPDSMSDREVMLKLFELTSGNIPDLIDEPHSEVELPSNL